MTKSTGKKVKKMVASKSKKAKSFLKTAKKKMNALKKESSKTLSRTKKKVYATEKEIVKYVKENPIKSISTVALVGLIAGFVSRLRK